MTGRHRSRGRRRNRAKRGNPPHRQIIAATPTPGESQTSANHRAGATIRYAWRIAGPTAKISTYSIDQLERGSKLHRER